MNIDWTQVIISLCALIITGVLVPLIKYNINKAKNELSADAQEAIEYWVEIGVRWAKQWLQSETGEKKKAEVMNWVSGKLEDLGIDLSADDLDKVIEAVYEQVKLEAKVEYAPSVAVTSK